MILSREAIQRMITDEIGGGGGGAGISGSALANLLTGYATQDWVGENYISIEFFSRLFQAHGTENNQQTDITPNDMDSTITSIEALFGFWTDLYISALGNGGSIGSSIYLSTLADVQLSSPATGQVLTYNATTGKWVNANPQGGVADLASLTDVTLTSLQDNQILVYDALAQKWFNSSVKTINGYSIFGTGNIDASGGGTGAYLPLAGGTMTGRIIFNYNRTSYDLTYQNNGSRRGGMGYWPALDILYINHDIAGRQLRLSPNANVSIVDLSASGEPDILTLTAAGNLVLHAQAGNILLGQLSHGPTTFTDGTPFACWVGNDSHNGFAYYTFSDLRTYLNDYYPHSSGFYTLDAGNITWGVLSTSNGYTTLMYWLTPIVSGDQGGYGFAYKGGQAYMQVDGFFYQNEGNYRVYDVSGGTINGSVYATGAVTALSDIRKKNIQTQETGVTVEIVANAPTIKFLWKEKPEEGLQVGSIAQYWQSVLPEVVRTEDDDCLSLQYGVAALVSAIITARKVVDHERRIQELEKENQDLRREISNIRVKTNIHMRGGIG